MRLSLAFTVLLTACLTPATATFLQCDLTIDIDVDSAYDGDEVTATGRPMTSIFDTSVRVGGIDAELVEVDRPIPFCESCDQCRVDEACDVCSSCDACAQSCAECIEIATFVVPAGRWGDAPVVVSNGYGTSKAIPFFVLESTDGDD